MQQCSRSRIWEETEVTLLHQIAREFLICLQPAQFQALMQERSEQLEKYQCRAYIVVPLFVDGILWGLLAAYQNSGPRAWQESDVNFMLQLSSPLSVAIQTNIQSVPESFHHIGLPTWVSRIAILNHKDQPSSILMLDINQAFANWG